MTCRRLFLVAVLLLNSIEAGFAQDQKPPSDKIKDEIQESWRQKAQKKILERELAVACAKATEQQGALNQCTCRPICVRGTLETLSGEDKDQFSACTDAAFCSGVAPPLVYQPHRPLIPDLFPIFSQPREVIG